MGGPLPLLVAPLIGGWLPSKPFCEKLRITRITLNSKPDDDTGPSAAADNLTVELRLKDDNASLPTAEMRKTSNTEEPTYDNA